jgi:hypothetical protein
MEIQVSNQADFNPNVGSNTYYNNVPCTGPYTVDTANQTGTWYFRIRQKCTGDVFSDWTTGQSYTFTTTTTSTTTTTTSTSTTTTTTTTSSLTEFSNIKYNASSPVTACITSVTTTIWGNSSTFCGSTVFYNSNNINDPLNGALNYFSDGTCWRQINTNGTIASQGDC